MSFVCGSRMQGLRTTSSSALNLKGFRRAPQAAFSLHRRQQRINAVLHSPVSKVSLSSIDISGRAADSVDTPIVTNERVLAVLAQSMHSRGSGFNPKYVFRNLSVPQLYEHALKYETSTHITSSGALAAMSGAKTGRSPKDKRVVKEAQTEKDIWWGGSSPNHPMDSETFMLNRQRAIDYLNHLDHVYVFDGFANWNAAARTKIRIITARPYHALFMHNMLIRPTPEELENFGEPDFVIYNAGCFPANKQTKYMTSQTSVDISVSCKEMVILGTEYAGEMKKGVFTIMHYLMPKRGILSLHSGCNLGAEQDVTLFFGLSGTGKTTLSTDPLRPLVGDDEHCWSEEGVFNIEGGCYAKCINLKKENEPEIYNAIKFGTVLENVVFDPNTREVDFESSAVTENTRACYPIDYIPNAHIPCVASHPKNIIMLCCDAFGVLPPVSRLTREQAMYHFISGYTAKVAGTEVGVTKPEATFSACFGAAFLMWHPMKYAAMLDEKIEEHETKVWLLNTGWVGGSAGGGGSRIKLRYTRALVDAIHNGTLEQQEFAPVPIFNLMAPKTCPGVPEEVLRPESQWADAAAFKGAQHHLAELFHKNFATFSDGHAYVGPELASRILTGGPQL